LIAAAGMLAACAQAAEAPDALTAVRELARSGATQLALQRIEVLQPQSNAPLWREWESLRLQLLAASGQHEAVLARAARWSGDAGTDLHETAARAALLLGRGAVAREQASRALWTAGITEPRLRELRLLAIRGLLADRLADDAWRSMLRFQQDYRPLDAAAAALFVDGLLDLGRAADAVQWLGQLDERGATRLRLRLHSGVVTAAEAVAQARAALNRSDDAAWWRVLGDTADRLPSPLLRIEVQEAQLERAGAGADASGGAVALWAAYTAHARGAANSHQLLAGDDAGWLEFARRRLAAEPVLGRAYLSLLSREAANDALRRSAQGALVNNLIESRLPRTALRLFANWPGGPAALADDARFVLATLAENTGNHAAAFDYRRGLAAPAGTAPAVWSLRLMATTLRAGRYDEATAIARQLASTAVAPAQLEEWIAVALQCADHGAFEAAQLLAERVLPLADAAPSRRLLTALAEGFARLNQPQFAADYFLRVAARAVDADAAAPARLQAGLNLARAGLREDARVQFEWLLKNARDPVQIALARRELGF